MYKNEERPAGIQLGVLIWINENPAGEACGIF